MERVDIGTEKYIINRYIPMVKLFERLKIPYTLNGNMYCPFHDNTNTKAAHLYLEEDSSYSLFCFSEHRMFGSWDVYRVFMSDVDTNKLAVAILEKFEEGKRKQVLMDVGEEKELKEIPYVDELESFKGNEITYKELVDKMVERMDNI